MDPPESSVTNRPPLRNPPPQFNISNYYHIHISSKCPVHNSLIQPHTHHHPSCPHHSLSPPPPSTLPLITQGDEDQAIFEDEEEEEPVFVLTDEWSNFFAKSDAKRKAVKKQAKKKEKAIRES